MIKKGVIITLFALSGVVLGATAAIPVCYALNEQYQNVASSQSDGNVMVKDEEVHLSTDENPLFPGDKRTLTIDLKQTIEKSNKVSVYFDKYSGQGYEYLSLSIKDEEQTYMPDALIESATSESPWEFSMKVGKQSGLSFVYTLSKDVPSTYEDLAFSFTMHLRVNWR